LTTYINANPGDIGKPDSAFRRVPLNFPRAPEPPARNADEWIARRAAADERLLWNKTCAECHDVTTAAASGSLPVYALSTLTRQWMPRAIFDHTPHAMVACASCHAAATSAKTSDVLMPSQSTCASCHAPSGRVPGSGQALRRGSGQAESRCFECHRYHDWTKSRPVTPSYPLPDSK
jgi:predicted CXXCH cytochrome family protein